MERIMTEYGVFTSNEITGQSAEEVFQAHLASHDYVDGEWIPKQIDIYLEPKTNQELTKELINAQIYITELELQNLEISIQQEAINQRLEALENNK